MLKKPGKTIGIVIVHFLVLTGSVALAQPSHQHWDDLLKVHVSAKGNVDYSGFIRDKEKLTRYLAQLSNNPPQQSWTKHEKLAYWINAYNAFTIKLIIDYYPVKSIQDLHPPIKIPGVNTVWHKKFFSIGNRPMSLDEIEHSILRREFDEPRIHFAIVCASRSCPPLRAEAFIADRLDTQLTDQSRIFINDPFRNRISENKIEISRIFDWFQRDFTKRSTLIQFLNQYSSVTIRSDASVSFLKYDWSLND